MSVHDSPVASPTNKKQFTKADTMAIPCTEGVNIFDHVWCKPQGNLRANYRAT